MKLGDSIILCTAEPDWIYGNIYDPALNNNLAFLETEILAGAHIRLRLAGDLHHYRRHSAEDGGQYITAGGGGAFLHPTHGLKVTDLKIGPAKAESPLTYVTSFPSPGLSKCLAWKNLLFLFFNPWFGMVTGVLYAILSWTVGPRKPTSIGNALEMLAYRPSAFGWTALTVGAFMFFTTTHSKLYRWLGGGLHGLAHVIVAFIAAWWIDRVATSLGVMPHSAGRVALVTAIVFAIGYVAGSILMGIYLLVSLNLFHRHSNEAFSALRIQDYKNFLRIKIDADGLTVYPVGITAVPRKWKASAGEQAFEPESGSVEGHLIEQAFAISPTPVGPAGTPSVTQGGETP